MADTTENAIKQTSVADSAIKSSKIMVVDDEPDVASIIARALNMAGFEHVNIFSDPEQALSNFKPSLYELIITDIKMPKMTGIEFYIEIRKVDKKVQVCFLTAFEEYRGMFDPLIANDLMAECIIKKPTKAAHLISIVVERLSKKK